MAGHRNAQKTQMTENLSSYEEWLELAIKHDAEYGLEKWKLEEKTRLYDYKSIQQRTEIIKHHRLASESKELIFCLNEGIHGNTAGIGSPELYKRAKFGTKALIIEYIDELSKSVDYIMSDEVDNITKEEKSDFLRRAAICCGKTGLFFSGAGMLLYFHIGVAMELHEQGILPSVISGSSGGAIVAALIGTREKDRTSEIFDTDFLNLNINSYTTFSKLKRELGLSRIDQSQSSAFIDRTIPDLTFEEAYNRSKIHINISVAPSQRSQSSRVLNAITSPHVLVRDAVLASCAVPGIYKPVQLRARNEYGETVPYLESRQWVDGSITDDIPLRKISRIFGVNHSIVSQANPLILPFLNETNNSNSALNLFFDSVIKTTKIWSLSHLKTAAKLAEKHESASQIAHSYISFISQKYSGDINITLPKRFNNPLSVLSPKTKEEIQELIAIGQRSTWPHIEKIRIQSKVSRTLSKYTQPY